MVIGSIKLADQPLTGLHSLTTSVFKPIMTKYKLVFTASVMDILHHGHLNLLNEMRKERTDLVVLHDGFTTFQNKKKLPIESLEKRTRNLIDTGLVDIIMHTYTKEPIEELNKIIQRYSDKFELVFMRGDDWEQFPGRSVIDKYNIPIKFVAYTGGVSSSALRTEL